ncbi:MAG: tRNA uridine-5-carboxymethylaminomethyl(34) synthesis enzyme MnmG [Mangrovibacterium sp.]
MMNIEYDVIVVGGGHAGCEAAAAAAQLGSRTLLITMDMMKFAQMSCNPAIGGIAKGQIVREIDALGGLTGIITDRTSIQFRMLNRSKGPAMWSPRSQCDRFKFTDEWRYTLESIEGLDLWQDAVVELLLEDGKVCGVKTQIGVSFQSKAVVLTNGTFLNGLMHIGKASMDGGRIGEKASYQITEQLAQAGFITGRLKTGTPVRIDERTIDFSKLTEQQGEKGFYKFSFLPEEKTNLKQRSCWITFTNPEVHQILKGGFQDSAMFDGRIEGAGPRYCPSIESKLITFAEKNQHHLFLEPEGERTVEYYMNGFSSSLAWDVQYEALHKIDGLEHAKIFRPGYAIEYDYFDPTQLNHSLETKLLENLYFAGQINGTTGYEEAAAQGLMAGINAHLKSHGRAPLILGRDEAYIGVLIDDLVTKGVDEPYRMFTSRAEYRILLRQDDADFRLTPKAFEIGLASQQRMDLLEEKIKLRDELIAFLNDFSIKPQFINHILEAKGSTPIKQGMKLKDIIARPQITIFDLLEDITPLAKFIVYYPADRRDEILEAAEIIIKYSGYIVRERQMADKFKRLEGIMIKGKFNYEELHTISTEARQKLAAIDPETLGQASRISGVSPADINVLLILLGR